MFDFGRCPEFRSISFKHSGNELKKVGTMIGKWLRCDLEDCLFMETLVLPRFGSTTFVVEKNGFEKRLRRIPIGPRQAEVSKRPYKQIMVLVRLDFMMHLWIKSRFCCFSAFSLVFPCSPLFSVFVPICTGHSPLMALASSGCAQNPCKFIRLGDDDAHNPYEFVCCMSKLL